MGYSFVMMWDTAVVLAMQRHTFLLDGSLRKALVARKADFSLRIFICFLASRGDQRPFAVRFCQHAPQPAMEES